MTGAQRSRPEGNRTATNISAGDTPIVADIADIHADLAKCSCTDWSNGFDAGYLAGTASATMSEEARAEAAGAAFYRMEAHQEWLSKFVPATISAMEVEANRRKPGSSYIPRRGDTRYSDRNTPANYALPEHEDQTIYSPDAPIVPGGALDRLRQRVGGRP